MSHLDVEGEPATKLNECEEENAKANKNRDELTRWLIQEDLNKSEIKTHFECVALNDVICLNDKEIEFIVCFSLCFVRFSKK